MAERWAWPIVAATTPLHCPPDRFQVLRDVPRASLESRRTPPACSSSRLPIAPRSRALSAGTGHLAHLRRIVSEIAARASGLAPVCRDGTSTARRRHFLRPPFAGIRKACARDTAGSNHNRQCAHFSAAQCLSINQAFARHAYAGDGACCALIGVQRELRMHRMFALLAFAAAGYGLWVLFSVPEPDTFARAVAHRLRQSVSLQQLGARPDHGPRARLARHNQLARVARARHGVGWRAAPPARPDRDRRPVRRCAPAVLRTVCAGLRCAGHRLRIPGWATYFLASTRRRHHGHSASHHRLFGCDLPLVLRGQAPAGGGARHLEPAERRTAFVAAVRAESGDAGGRASRAPSIGRESSARTAPPSSTAT